MICAKLFHLNKGLAAGLAGGALTQSAIIGTAGDAIARLGLPADQVKSLQSDVAIAYAVTYVFGSLGAIIVCVNILPKFMGQSLRDASIQAERELTSGAPSAAPGQLSALPEMVGRAYKIDVSAGKTVKAVETQHQDFLTIERIKRDGQQLDPTPDLVLKPDDVVLVVGRREAVVAFGASGGEVATVEDVGVVMQTRQGVFTRKGMNHTTIAAAREVVDRDMRHGVYIQGISRAGQPLPILPETQIEHGDVITFYGSPKDTKRAVDAAGYELPYSIKTDFIYMGVGLVLGLADRPDRHQRGRHSAHAGLGRRLSAGRPAVRLDARQASHVRRDALGGFAAAAGFRSRGVRGGGGLNSGLQAVVTVKQLGITIFLLGVFVTLFPLLLTMLFGRYVLKYNNAAHSGRCAVRLTQREPGIRRRARQGRKRRADGAVRDHVCDRERRVDAARPARGRARLAHTFNDLFYAGAHWAIFRRAGVFHLAHWRNTSWQKRRATRSTRTWRKRECPRSARSS